MIRKLRAEVEATSVRLFRAVVVVLAVAAASRQGVLLAQFQVPPVSTCTVTSITGNPVSGTVCGGSSHGGACTAGAIYKCSTNSATNNCVLQQACSRGCVTNGSQLNDSCFSGAFAPISVTPTNTPGGNDLSVALELDNAHPNGAYVNLKIDRGDVIPGAYCAPPFQLAAGQNTTTFGLSTAVVSSTTLGHIYSDLSYTDASGVSHESVSTPQTVTLNPGGTAPPTPPLASFTMSPSTLNAGGSSLVDAALTKMAPAAGVQITLTSSDPATASIIANGQPLILGSCLTAEGGSFAIQAARNVPQTTTVTISASSGAAGQAPLQQPLTVNAGCVPATCSGGPSCGPTPDGCGGTLNCGCTNLPGQTCGGGGVPNQCGPAVLSVSSVSMNPSSVVAGNSSTGTVTLNGAAPSGGALVGISSTSSFVTVPSSITIPQGQTTGTFVANTVTFTAGTVSAQISAAKGTTVNTTLTVTAATASCTPTTCAAQGKNCGTISDGCGGTLTCGSCTSPQTCGGGGVANLCGASSSTAVLTLTATGRSGETIVSSPSGLRVSVGSTGSASFPVGTKLTLSDANGRDVIWSGVCSSGGNTAKQCAFTLQANSSETANVQ